MLRDKRQQCQVPGPLDRHGQGTLVLGTVTAFPARGDFPTVRDILPKHCGFFIIDVLDFIPAKEADLSLGDVFSPS